MWYGKLGRKEDLKIVILELVREYVKKEYDIELDSYPQVKKLAEQRAHSYAYGHTLKGLDEEKRRISYITRAYEGKADVLKRISPILERMKREKK
jgi:hypothetical protein